MHAERAVDAGSLKQRVRSWWNARPCGVIVSSEPIATKLFFEQVERHRYQQEPHIPEVADFTAWAGKQVLEVGCGLGTDLARFARGGANCTGLDLTSAAVNLTATRFSLEGLSGRFSVGDAENLAFADATFDLVYSHGVLHHTPDTQRAISEVHRVLKPGGTAIVMLYHKHSFNYLVTIRLVRRAGFALLRRPVGRRIVRLLAGASANRLGDFEQLVTSSPSLSSEELLNNNTDGAGNPLSRVFSRREARKMFREFESVRTTVHWLVQKNIPVIGRRLPRFIDYQLGRLAGWDLYIIATKKK